MPKSSIEERRKVGIWIRVSTEDQVRGESPEHHERRARSYAESKDWEVVEIYRLEAVSGKAVMGHPDTQRMLTDIRQGHITGLIFSKLARLARNTKELLEFAEIFRESGADLISLQESIDTSTPAGRLFYTMIAAMAQWEREEIAERIAASVHVRAQMGKSLGGKAPFGYQWKDGSLSPHPEHAPVRRLVYELFLQHRRKKTVARLLNEAGYRTQSGKRFSDSTIKVMIEDPTAKGIHRSNYTRSIGKKKPPVLKPEKDWVCNPVDPIVSEDLWNQCNFILTEQRNSRKPPAKRPAHLFTGIVRCGCGERMYVSKKSPKYICRKCRTKIPEADLETIFCEQLRGYHVDPAEIVDYLAQAEDSIKEKEGLLAALERERRRVQDEMDQTYRLYIDTKISPDGFSERYNPLEERRGQIDDEIPHLQAEIDFAKISYLSRDQILNEARDLYSRWSDLTMEERRVIVEQITQEIRVGTDGIIIDLCYLPSLQDVSNRQSINHGAWQSPRDT